MLPHKKDRKDASSFLSGLYHLPLFHVILSIILFALLFPLDIILSIMLITLHFRLDIPLQRMI